VLLVVDGLLDAGNEDIAHLLVVERELAKDLGDLADCQLAVTFFQ
jgi:hypothetical protein